MAELNNIQRHIHNGTDAPRIAYDDLRDVPALPAGLADAPLTAVTAPTGGGTIDAEARTAINTLITRLETLGLIEEN